MSYSELARQGEVRLTTDGRTKADPVFVRGGAEIVFTVLESAAQFSLMRLQLADGTLSRLHPGATTSEFEAAFSPDGRYYAFVQSRGNLNLKLAIRDTKLNRDALFEPGGGFAGMRRPTIAPDGSRIVFSLPNATGQQLVAVDMEGKDRKDLTQAGINNWPAFSPDGKYLAFGSSRDGDFEIYAMKSDGNDVRRLTRSPGLDMRPAWSPDGRRIAFTSNRDGRYQVYLMNADGRSTRRVRTAPERDDYAAWHPDGKRLVVVSERDGRSDLYLIDVPE
jgi:TolB protein